MTQSGAQVKAVLVSRIREAVAREDFDFQDVLKRVNLTGDVLDDPLQSVPLDSVFLLFEELSRRLDDPGFGIHIAEKVQPGGAALLSQVVLNAPTVRAALQCVGKYHSAYITQGAASFRESDQSAALCWTLPRSKITSRIQYNCFLMSLLVSRLRAFIGKEWKPLSVSFDHLKPDCDDLIRETFGDRVAFEAAETQIKVDARHLVQKNPNADPSLFAMLNEYADKLVAEADHSPEIVAATRSEIMGLLAKHEASLDIVARNLGLTSRSLQWRLSQVDTTFEDVLSTTRESLARRLLQDTNRPLTEIAYDLGYADPSVFTRAAKRWFGMSPRAYRQSIRDKNQNQS